jgi:hypothetical protein
VARAALKTLFSGRHAIHRKRGSKAGNENPEVTETYVYVTESDAAVGQDETIKQIVTVGDQKPTIV